MKGNQDVIDALNAGLTIELTAINQYFICSKMCADWGLHKLAKHFYAESIEEMDSGSRDLMERMVVESEESIDWAETQFDLIELIGLKKYLAEQVGEEE